MPKRGQYHDMATKQEAQGREKIKYESQVCDEACTDSPLDGQIYYGMVEK